MSANVKRTKRVVIAHSKDTADDVLARYRTQVLQLAKDPISVTLGFDDYKHEFERAGNWEMWARSVAERYDIVVVPSGPVGSGAARIVENALHRGKLVFALSTDGSRLTNVKGCTKVSKDNGGGYILE